MPLSPTTINYALHVLKFILKDAMEQGHLTESPAAHVKPLRSLEHADDDRLQVLQPGEIMRLLNASEEPYSTLYQVAVGTGCRRGELLGLRWGDLDLHKGLLHVRRTRGRVKDGEDYVIREASLKTRYSRHTIDLSPALVQALLAFPAGDDPDEDYVFRSPQTGGPLDPDNLDRRFQADLTLAGLPEIRFHDLRHTHATLLIAAGVHPKAIQACMGHASITTTLNTYGHLMPNAFHGVGAKLDALFQIKRPVTV